MDLKRACYTKWELRESDQLLDSNSFRFVAVTRYVFEILCDLLVLVHVGLGFGQAECE